MSVILNEQLIEYIQTQILPVYVNNDEAHNIKHINYVIKRSLKFASSVENINYNMVYVIAVYHDIGHYIDTKNHEKVSAKIFLLDENMKIFFNKEEIKIMAEAIEDHRANLESEPRSIYGKIVSSADRNTSIDEILRRTYSYRKKHCPHYTLEEMAEESRIHIIDKFGSHGYAKDKMYFYDEEYINFLSEVDKFAKDKELFFKKFFEVNNEI